MTVQKPVPAPQAPVATSFPNPASPIGASGPMSFTALAVGLLAVAWPLAWAPAWAYVVSAAGALAVLAAVFAVWRPAPALAVTAAIASAAFSHAGTAALTAEGLFILGYLLVADAPQVRPSRWLRSQLRPYVAGLIASGAVLAALWMHPASSPWLAVAGLAAGVAAYLTALPSARRLSRYPAATAVRPGQAAADPADSIT
jgi:hypothetical protein